MSVVAQWETPAALTTPTGAAGAALDRVGGTAVSQARIAVEGNGPMSAVITNTGGSNSLIYAVYGYASVSAAFGSGAVVVAPTTLAASGVANVAWDVQYPFYEIAVYDSGSHTTATVALNQLSSVGPAGATGPTGPAGEGGAAWRQHLLLDGSDFSGFTVINGTWASSGGTINQTDASGTRFSCYVTAAVPLGVPFIWEAEVQHVGTPAGDAEAGLCAYMPTNFNGCANSKLFRSSGATRRVDTDRAAEANVGSTTFAWGESDEWHKLSMVVDPNGALNTFVDGVWAHYARDAVNFSGSAKLQVGLAAMRSVKYRNLSLWIPELP